MLSGGEEELLMLGDSDGHYNLRATEFRQYIFLYIPFGLHRVMKFVTAAIPITL